MAIAENDVIHKFGTQDDLDSSSAAVADDAFSVAGDLAQWTNDDDAPAATVILNCNFSSAPTAYTHVHLYARLMNIEGTDDSQAPDANFGHTYLGSFPLNDNTTEQWVAIEVALPNVYTSQVYEFYIENKAGQSIPSGWKLLITPKTFGPHPA